MLDETKTPQNKETEKTLLGSILSNGEILFDLDDTVNKDLFFEYKNQVIYSAIETLYQSGKPVNIMSVSQQLDKTSKAKETVSKSYLSSLTNVIGGLMGAKRATAELKELFIKRELLRIFNAGQIDVQEGEIAENILSGIQNKFIALTDDKSEGSSVKDIIKDLSDTQLEYSEKYERGEKYIGIPTGFEKIDNAIDGLRPGHLWVVGAWTSTGKTQFAMNIVSNVIKSDVPTSVVSLEMSGVDTLARILGIRIGISSMKVLKGKMDKELWSEIEKQKDILYNSPLWVHTTKFHLDKIKSTIRKDVYKNKVRFVVVDYVQNIMSSSGKKEYDLMTNAARELQSLAQELGITIYIVSQISNEAEKGQSAGAGFKGTGALEAAADIAIRLKRDKGSENEMFEVVPVDIIISKNRHGFTGISKYNMTLKSGKFEEVIDEEVDTTKTKW